jgi:hypothetical protein
MSPVCAVTGRTRSSSNINGIIWAAITAVNGAEITRLAQMFVELEQI